MTESREPNCPREEDLDGYVKGTCPADVAAAIRAHLETCDVCRQWVDDARANEVLLESVRVLMQKDRPASGTPAAVSPNLPVIEGYEILEEIGRGGMGVVYRALQIGTRRTVALKVLLDGPLASESVRRRFEREIELAASLSHPNVVAIHDSGLSRGHYYFAMDFIQGQRLDRYIKGRDLPIEHRLRLMQKICLAVNYAHQRGVIHRDLKPGNILVDSDGEPHILDFGLAKTLESSPQAESLLLSISGEVLGTLPYMAPEQAAGQQGEIDSRTDVYTLGVILYELLTGKYPYVVAGQMADVLRNIAHAEPARPSTIYRAIRNDLETIVLKTLSKDKEHRYDSAGALAADIGRYMAGEAIEAKRDSSWYVLRKMLRRHKVPAAAAAILLVSVVCVAVAMSSLYARAEQHRRLAQAAAVDALWQRRAAEDATRDLSEELHTRKVDQGRSLVLAGDLAQGEYILWRELLQQPGDTQTLWALREAYAQQPCLSQALASTVPLCSVAFAPDGKTIATADVAGAIKVWEVPSCRLALTIFTQAPDVTSLAFAPDGKGLACSSSDETVRLLDLPTGKCTARFPAASSSQPAILPDAAPASCRPAYRLAFDPTGRLLATCQGNDVVIRDLSSGKSVATLSAHQKTVTSVAFSPDGKSLASAGLDHSVILWDLEGGRARATLASHLDIVSCVTFSPDGQLLASADWDGTVILWRTSDGACLASLEDFGCWVHSVAFSPDGCTLAAGDIHGNVKIWDLATGRCTSTIPAHVEGMAEPLRPAVALAYGPGGDMLATGSTLGVLKLWDLSGSKPMRTLSGHAGSVLAAGYASGGRTLASRDEQGTIRLWDLATGRCDRAIAGPQAIPAAPTSVPAVDWDNDDLADAQQSLACSPAGDLIASVEIGGEAIALHDVASGRCVGRLVRQGGKVLSVTFSPGGKMLASGDGDGSIRLWDTSSQQCVRAIPADGAAAPVVCLMFSPDGRLLATASGHTLRILSTAPGQEMAVFRGHIDKIHSLAFYPSSSTADGWRLASAGNDGVLLWDISTGKQLGRLEGQAGATYALALSPDGRTLACSDHNRTIRLWQIPSGRHLATLQTGGRLTWSLAFRPDGRMLACGGGGDSLRLFNLAYYDRHIVGNYPFYLELAGRWPETFARTNRQEMDRWARSWAAAEELPLWAGPGASAATSKETGVDPAVIADWGQLSRHRLLSALRSLGHKLPQAHLPVEGAMDPPTASLIFGPAAGDVRIHTLLGSGNSPERIRAAEYQQQRSHGMRPVPATRPAADLPVSGSPPA
jgi:eukaryotic-like serine/threonine-protein kinase